MGAERASGRNPGPAAGPRSRGLQGHRVDEDPSPRPRRPGLETAYELAGVVTSTQTCDGS